MLNDFDAVIRSVRPLTVRQTQQLPADVRRLFHYLTDERGARRSGYLNETPVLTAYLYYYHWWNLVRLSSLFAGMPASAMPGADMPGGGEIVCADIGCGPLTVPTALWLSRPELRARKLTWYCVDTSQNALSVGTDLFYACAARAPSAAPRGEPWRIIKVKGSFGTELRKKACFVSAANMFNEFVHEGVQPLEQTARRCAVQLDAYTLKAESSAAAYRSRIFVAEPGIPQNARFLSFLRASLMKRRYEPVSPCPHGGACALDARRGGKWCHFVLDAPSAAPRALREFSKKAQLEKTRAAVSFVLMEYAPRGAPRCADAVPESVLLRAASDPIRLPRGQVGFYCCSRYGLALLRTDAAHAAAIRSGDLLHVPVPAHETRDEKTGARVFELAAASRGIEHTAARGRRNVNEEHY